MELFDYMKVLFEQGTKYEELKSYDKTKNAFMLNRFMSINHPVQAQMFNKLGINSVGVADSWRMVGRQYKRVPGWIYTKVRKSEKQKEKEFRPNEEALEMFMRINQIGEREYKEALKFSRDEVIDALKRLEKQIGNKERT
jgi:NACalpha-BTF3-like transcription factor